MITCNWLQVLSNLNVICNHWFLWLQVIVIVIEYIARQPVIVITLMITIRLQIRKGAEIKIGLALDVQKIWRLPTCSKNLEVVDI